MNKIFTLCKLIALLTGIYILTGECMQESNLPKGVIAYLKSLPTIDNREEKNSENCCTAILNLLQKFSIKPSPQGIDALKEKLLHQCNLQKTIELVFIGFACKANNTENKVLGINPDLADYVALLTLNHICSQIKTIYSPGARIEIYTQEPFIHEMSSIAKEIGGLSFYAASHIAQYQDKITSLISLFNPQLKLSSIADIEHVYAQEKKQINLADTHNQDLQNYRIFMQESLDGILYNNAIEKKLFEELQNNTEARDAFINKFKKAKKSEPFIQAVKENKSFEVISQLPFYKDSAGKELGIRNRKKEIAEKLAICALTGAYTMRMVMKKNIANYDSKIRLSVHASDNINEKLGIHLIYGSKGTPWHNTLLVSQKSIRLLPLKKSKNSGSICYYPIANQELGYINEK